MACAVENYQPMFYGCPSYSQDDSVFLEAAWLQPDVSEAEEFELNTEFKSPALPILSYHKHKTSSIAPEARAPAWWESELASSVHKTLRRKEGTKIEMKSPQLAFRTEMVDFMSAVCRSLDISTGTRHTAIRLMDFFMDGHNVMYYRLKLVALTCLLIAAKFEERDDCIPSIDSLHYSAKLVDPTTTFIPEEMVTLELYALKFFKWNISRPGIAHFIDYYLHVSLNMSTTDCTGCWDNNKLLESQLQEFTAGFMEAALREQQFLSYDPSKVAAAIVCVIRICTSMERAWTPELETASSYTLHDLQPIASHLLRLYEELGR